MGKFDHLFGIDLNCDGEIDDLERIVTYNLITGNAKNKSDDGNDEYFGGAKLYDEVLLCQEKDQIKQPKINKHV